MLDTQLKPAEAKHLSLAEYDRFNQWWNKNYPHLWCLGEPECSNVRALVLNAYIYALEPIPYSARLR